LKTLVFCANALAFKPLVVRRLGHAPWRVLGATCPGGNLPGSFRSTRLTRSWHAPQPPNEQRFKKRRSVTEYHSFHRAQGEPLLVDLANATMSSLPTTSVASNVPVPTGSTVSLIKMA